MESKQYFYALVAGLLGFAIGLGIGGAVAWNFVSKDAQVTSVVAEQVVAEQVVEEQIDDEQTNIYSLESSINQGIEYSVLNKRTFEKDGEDYAVMHLCRPDFVYGDYTGFNLLKPVRCGYEDGERLVLSHGDSMIDLKGEGFNAIGSRQQLFDAALFPDGKSVMVIFEEDTCAGALGMCIDLFDRVYLFDLQTGQAVDQFPTTGYIFSLKNLLFNDDATKFIVINGCPEGCPDDVAVGFDLVKKQEVTFKNQVSGWEGEAETTGWMANAEKSYWVDHDTFRLFVFKDAKEGVEINKEVDLTF